MNGERGWVGIVVVGMVLAGSAGAGGQEIFREGSGETLATIERGLEVAIREKPDDGQAHYGLGVVRFFRAIERLGQGLYRYGLKSDVGQQVGVPFLRLPVPKNPKPESINPDELRQLFVELVNDLSKAEATLGEAQKAIGPDVKLPLRLALVRVDLTGDGKVETAFLDLMENYVGERAARLGREQTVMLDRADVAWMRGYCHLLSALAEVVLGYDQREWFETCGHLFFADVETPYAFLKERRNVDADAGPFGDFDSIVDLIAGVHTLRWPVKEPERLKAALAHLERMIGLSREFWEEARSESDDEQEWIPNARQAGAFATPVTEEMIDGWLAFLDETEALLAGRRLVPFWRGGETRGINLRRVFVEPGPLDLVLWVQGTAAAPYLEQGELTKPEVWERLGRVFRGDFIGFALWFN